MGNHGTWRGIDREQIPWFPTLDPSKCAGCKECLNFCQHKVYSWDEANDRTVVAQPYDCVVGCSNCAGLCKEGAISFPPLSILKGLGK